MSKSSVDTFDDFIRAIAPEVDGDVPGYADKLEELRAGREALNWLLENFCDDNNFLTVESDRVKAKELLDACLPYASGRSEHRKRSQR